MIRSSNNPLIDDDIEVSVLQSVIDWPEAARHAFDSITGLTFGDVRRGWLFVALRWYFKQDGALDALMLNSQIEKYYAKRLHQAKACKDVIQETLEATSQAAQIETYCERLKDLHNRRMAVLKAAELGAKASDPQTDVTKLFDKAAREISQGKSVGVVQGSVAAMDAEIEEAKAGRRFCVPLPFPQLSRCTRMLSPGKLACICGSGGKGKSLLINQWVMWWQSQWKTAVLELEDGVVFHTRRALAQMTGDNRFTQDEFFTVPENIVAYEAAKMEYAAELEPFTRSLYELHRDEKPTFEFVLDWMRSRAADGCRIIGIDPFTKLRGSPGDRRQLNDQQHEFIVDAISIMQRYNASFFMVTHPRKNPSFKNRGEVEMDDLAGSAAVQNHARCIVWYYAIPEKEMDVRTLDVQPVQTKRVNRVIKILKANESYGAGMKIGLEFDGKSLCVTEQGIIE